MAFGSPQWMYASGEDFTLDQSLRFNPTDDSHLTKTFGTPTSNQKCSCSVWVKLGLGLDIPSTTIINAKFLDINNI